MSKKPSNWQEGTNRTRTKKGVVVEFDLPETRARSNTIVARDHDREDQGTQDQQLTPNFMLSQFAVSDAYPDLIKVSYIPARFIPVATNLARLLEVVQDHVGMPLRILSGYRTAQLNRAVKGEKYSVHCHMGAADITCDKPRALFEGILELISSDALSIATKSEKPGALPVWFFERAGQIIYYPERNFVHFALTSAKFSEPTPCLTWREKYKAYAFTPDKQELHRLLENCEEPPKTRERRGSEPPPRPVNVVSETDRRFLERHPDRRQPDGSVRPLSETRKEDKPLIREWNAIRREVEGEPTAPKRSRKASARASKKAASESFSGAAVDSPPVGCAGKRPPLDRQAIANAPLDHKPPERRRAAAVATPPSAHSAADPPVTRDHPPIATPSERNAPDVSERRCIVTRVEVTCEHRRRSRHGMLEVVADDEREVDRVYGEVRNQQPCSLHPAWKLTSTDPSELPATRQRSGVGTAPPPSSVQTDQNPDPSMVGKSYGFDVSKYEVEDSGLGEGDIEAIARDEMGKFLAFQNTPPIEHRLAVAACAGTEQIVSVFVYPTGEVEYEFTPENIVVAVLGELLGDWARKIGAAVVRVKQAIDDLTKGSDSGRGDDGGEEEEEEEGLSLTVKQSFAEHTDSHLVYCKQELSLSVWEWEPDGIHIPLLTAPGIEALSGYVRAGIYLVFEVSAEAGFAAERHFFPANSRSVWPEVKGTISIEGSVAIAGELFLMSEDIVDASVSAKVTLECATNVRPEEAKLMLDGTLTFTPLTIVLTLKAFWGFIDREKEYPISKEYEWSLKPKVLVDCNNWRLLNA